MHRKSVVIAIVAVFIATGTAASQVQPSNRGPGGARGTQIQPGEQCPPGTTEIRPRNCLGPEAPAPSILDYRPKSTLVTKGISYRTDYSPDGRTRVFVGHNLVPISSGEAPSTMTPGPAPAAGVAR